MNYSLNSVNNGSHKKYINGLKGFACIMVMAGHYIGLYGYAEKFPAGNALTELLGRLLDSDLNFIINESFWVVLFFVVSGYLVSMSNIRSIKPLVRKSIMRFLRLGLPVLFAYAIIFLIYKTIGFHNSETLEFFENSFIQKSYTGEYTFWDVIKSPFDVLIMGKTSLNSPFWVLREMLITSVIIYFLTWLKNRIKNENIFVIILSAVFTASMILSNVVFAGIFGMLVYLLENDKDKAIRSNKIFISVSIVFCALLYIIPRSRITCIFFGALILLIPRLPLVNTVFSSGFSQFINKISFGIYSFHWPVFCSLGMLSLIFLQKHIGLITACVLSALLSAAVSVVISVLFYHIIEKHIYALLKKAEKRGGKNV